MAPSITLLCGGILLLILFIATWRISLKIDNFSFVDVTWSYAFAPVAVLYALALDGWWPRRLVIAALMTMWSLRLGTYLLRRVRSHHPEEDRRYAVLRERWAGNLDGAFLKFFIAQALLVWLLTLPVFLICREAQAQFHPLETIGFALWLLAVCGEGLADSQLKRFKRNSSVRTEVCREGLWRFSRHPNYFFQSLLWWGLFLMALPSPWGWAAILAPLAMLWFLLRVTGIPLTEELAVQSKGANYIEYQKSTSALVPWFSKT